MKIQIFCIGKVKDSYTQKQIYTICNSINKGKHHIEIIEFPDKKIPAHLKEDKIDAFVEKECEKINNKIGKKDFVIALCIEGKELTIKQHGDYVRKAIEEQYDCVSYIIGGSLGLPQSLKKRANLRLSFSKMTFPHQLMRMILCEEIETMLHDI